jgi:CelD/BcsL family acetyltransferase involved in cellulose biosynthesis
MTLEIEVFDSFDAAATAWSEFQKSGTLYVFQTREWLENWYQHVGGRSPVQPCLVSVFNDETPVAFFPFQVRAAGALRVLNWLGDELIDYGAPILGPGSTVDFPEVWAEVVRHLPAVDLIHLTRIPETVGAVANPMCRLNCRRYHNSAHFVELAGDWEDFYQRHAGAKTRSTDRRKHRRLSEMGTLEFKVTDGSAESVFADISGQMIGQKIERYRDMRAPNIMAGEGVRDLFSRPTAALRQSGLLHVSALELGGDVVTTHWGMKHGDRFYYFLPSYADGPWMKYSPGRLLLFELFKWSFENGVKVFDFTIGDESYKKDWCDREVRLFHYIEARTGKGRIVRSLRLAAAALLANPFVLTVARKIRRLFH